MLEISKDANKNYLCKVVVLKNLQKHSNADRLQVVSIDFNNVITGMDAKEGDVYVYFPVEGKISEAFLAATNSFRDYTLNDNYKMSGLTRRTYLDNDENKSERVVGFFDDKCRVKAVKLRGEKSMGYIVPSHVVSAWAGYNILATDANTEFDTIAGKKIVEKYVVKKNEPRVKQGKAPKVNRLVDGQVHLHVDTENLRRNAHKIHPEDLISITYKTHGTSWWTGNVLVKRALNWYERLLIKLGVSVQELEYDVVYGSRKVVKNKSFEDPKGQDHFFGYDLWEDIKNKVGIELPKGYTLYGEMIGYDRNGGAIQKGYDYGCVPDGEEALARTDAEGSTQSKLEVYRITHTNSDGLVTELGLPERLAFCQRLGLSTPYVYYYGKAKDWLNMVEGRTIDTGDHWNELFVNKLQETFNDRNCFMCTNKVPEEGIVVRKESLFSCDSYKLKSPLFLIWESKELDSGVSDMESEN